MTKRIRQTGRTGHGLRRVSQVIGPKETVRRAEEPKSGESDLGKRAYDMFGEKDGGKRPEAKRAESGPGDAFE